MSLCLDDHVLNWTDGGSQRDAAAPAMYFTRRVSHEKIGEAPQFG